MHLKGTPPCAVTGRLPPALLDLAEKLAYGKFVASGFCATLQRPPCSLRPWHKGPVLTASAGRRRRRHHHIRTASLLCHCPLRQQRFVVALALLCWDMRAPSDELHELQFQAIELLGR